VVTDVIANGINDAGDTIVYSFEVTAPATNNVTINNIAITDATLAALTPPPAITCPITSLAPGTSTTCTAAAYTITAADVAAGKIENTASAAGTTPGGSTPTSPTDTETVTLEEEVATLTIDKSSVFTDTVADGINSVGDTVVYSFEVTAPATNNIDINNIAINDATLAALTPAPTISCPLTTLAPGASTTCTASAYTITAADVANGEIENTATASGTTPAGSTPTSPIDTETVTLVEQDPSLSVDKSASVGTLKANGTVDVTFTLETENTGNVPLLNLTLVDDLQTQFGSAFNGVVTQPTISGAAATGSTAPAQTTSYTGANSLIGTGGVLAVGDKYTVVFTVNVDMNASGAPSPLANTATTGATAPGSTSPITDDSNNSSDPSNNGTDGTPAGTGVPTIITTPSEIGTIGLVKSAVLNDDDGIAGVSAGDTIDYTYVVTNTSSIVNVYNVNVTEPASGFTGTGIILLKLMVQTQQVTQQVILPTMILVVLVRMAAGQEMMILHQYLSLKTLH